MRPMKKSLKRALEKQKEPSPPLGQEDFDDLIAVEIEKNKEFWLDNVNFHLDKLLKRAKKNNKMKWHMAMHYCTRNNIFQIRIKKLKKKLKQTLMRKKEKDKLDLLDEASLIS